MPRLTPRLMSTCASGLTRYSSYTPRSCMDGVPGLVSGPKILNTVRNPSSFRIAPTYFMELWYFCAKKKHIPTSFKSSTHLLGLCEIFTPSASRQSAVPHNEEAARLPCFATFIPPAAATIAEVVEILKLCALSPPVPTISKSSMPVSTLVACALIAAAQPAISSVVSALALFVDSAARKAAFCVAVVSPPIISFITVYASS